MANINKNKKYHFIYKTTNLINNQFYIGMHSTSNIKDGYLGSGKRLKRSLKKYGENNFKFEILEFLPTRESLINREIELVNGNLLKDALCINLKLGGSGGFSNKQQSINAKKSNEKQKVLRETDKNWATKTKINRSKSQKKIIRKWY